MNEIEIVEVGLEDVPALAALAAEIWHQHFPPIIGREAVDYMVEKFQSESAMTHQLEVEGYRYYFLMFEGERVGYTAIKPEANSLFLSKIYVRQAVRGKGISRVAIEFMVDFCRMHQFQKIWLTVNRENLIPIAAYRKMGFAIVRTQLTDIGHGFFMDDYVMEKGISLGEEV